MTLLHNSLSPIVFFHSLHPKKRKRKGKYNKMWYWKLEMERKTSFTYTRYVIYLCHSSILFVFIIFKKKKWCLFFSFRWTNTKKPNWKEKKMILINVQVMETFFTFLIPFPIVDVFRRFRFDKNSFLSLLITDSVLTFKFSKNLVLSLVAMQTNLFGRPFLVQPPVNNINFYCY